MKIAPEQIPKNRPKPVKILCLFVRHGTEAHPEALKILDEWYHRHGLINERTLWIIDNARAPELHPESLSANTSLRSGDNEAWEFSAWAHALKEAQSEGLVFDIIHFVTSAFNTLYTEYLKHFERGMLSYVQTHRTCLGHIDGYAKPITLGTGTSQTWIRTCFFFLPWDDALKISPWASYRDPAALFVSPHVRQFRPDAPVSCDYQAHITNWLEGQEMGGHTWHSPVTKSAEETSRFQKKTLAILNEHQLSITFRCAGIRLVDFCWLHSLWAASNQTILQPVPELDQLKVRRKVLGIPE